MSGNLWILVGVIALAFSGYAIPHGFFLRDQPKQSFSLADCSFDMILEIPAESLQAFSKALPQESGTLLVIIHISDGAGEHGARIQLTGQWHGTTGIISQYSEDLIVFNLSERRFMLLHKKPVIEYVPQALTRLSAGNRYSVEMTAFPGFAIPLIPKKIQIRTHDGVLYIVSDFRGPDKGWYLGTLSL